MFLKNSDPNFVLCTCLILSCLSNSSAKSNVDVQKTVEDKTAVDNMNLPNDPNQASGKSTNFLSISRSDLPTIHRERILPRNEKVQEFETSGTIIQEKDLESQAIKVVHPRNRKLPTHLIATSNTPPVTLENGIPTKITKTSGMYEEHFSQDRLLPSKTTSPNIRHNSNSSDGTKQGRLVDEKAVSPSFEEFAEYLKYLSEKQKSNTKSFATINSPSYEKERETLGYSINQYVPQSEQNRVSQNQIPHKGSYEPVPFNNYYQPQNSFPPQSRTTPHIDLGKELYSDVRRRPTLDNLSPTEAANVNTPQELLDHCCKFPACYDPLYELCIDTCRKCETDYPVTSWLPCPPLLNMPDCTSNSLNGQLGRLPLACFPDIGPFANIMPVSNVMKMPSYHRSQKLDLSGRTKEGLAVMTEDPRTDAGVYDEDFFGHTSSQMTRYDEPTRREQDYRRSMQSRNRKFCNEEGICQSERRNPW